MIGLGKWRRRAQLAVFRRLSPRRLVRLGERRALRAFRTAARRVPAYRTLLTEHGVDASTVRGLADFSARCPVLSKETTFGKYSLDELCRPGALDKLATVLTSSGRGAAMAFGLTTRDQARRAARTIDLGLEQAFRIDSRRTLLINCLPMGVRFPSDVVTIAEVSVREDMALALASNFGPYYDQIILVGDPLFLKRLTDAAEEQGIDWGAMRVNVIIGEETFGENFRSYLANRLAVDIEDARSGLIGSSMGIGELGLNLFYETRETIALRRRAVHDGALAVILFGRDVVASSPAMLFEYNPLQVLVEILDEIWEGFGELVVTLTEKDVPLPLVRYRTGDLARLVARDRLAEECRRRGLDLPPSSGLPLVAIAGGVENVLPDGRNVLDFKDALYRDHEVARALSGAFRLEWRTEGPRMNVQLGDGAALTQSLSERLGDLLPEGLAPDGLVLWPYETFPFGMGLDYERKFAYVSFDDATAEHAGRRHADMGGGDDEEGP